MVFTLKEGILFLLHVEICHNAKYQKYFSNWLGRSPISNMNYISPCLRYYRVANTQPVSYLQQYDARACSGVRYDRELRVLSTATSAGNV